MLRFGPWITLVAMAAIVTCSQTIACESSVERVWSILSDTDRLNWAVGMNALKFTPLENKTAARYQVKTRLGGFMVTYEESPYEWNFPERFSVHRTMLTGPIKSLDMIFELKPRQPLGCDVVLTTHLLPRWGILRPVVALRGNQSIGLLAEEVRRIDESLAKGGKEPSMRRTPLINTKALEAGLAELQEHVAPRLGEQLARYLHTANDMEVASMRPFALADLWGTERSETLQLFFAAAQARLVEARWQVICPSCRVPSVSLPSLKEVGSHAACHFCDIGFQVDMDDMVEIMFLASPQVRSIVLGQYCVGGPARTPHVLVQKVVPAGARILLTAPTRPGEYRLFVRGGNECTLRVLAEQPTQVRLVCGEVNRLKPVSVAPSGKIELENVEEKALHAKIEDASWSSQGATAKDVMRLTVSDAPFDV